MHKQVDRIYELKEYMRFHARSFKKLLKLRDSMHKADDDDKDPVWDEMDDAVEDLDQYDYYLDTLKERFLNLIELVSQRIVEGEGECLRELRSSILRTRTNPTIQGSCLSLQRCICRFPTLL